MRELCHDFGTSPATQWSVLNSQNMQLFIRDIDLDWSLKENAFMKTCIVSTKKNTFIMFSKEFHIFAKAKTNVEVIRYVQ